MEEGASAEKAGWAPSTLSLQTSNPSPALADRQMSAARPVTFLKANTTGMKSLY